MIKKVNGMRYRAEQTLSVYECSVSGGLAWNQDVGAVNGTGEPYGL